MYIELIMEFQFVVATFADDMAAPGGSCSSDLPPPPKNEVCFPVFWSHKSVSVSPKDGVSAVDIDPRCDRYDPLESSTDGYDSLESPIHDDGSPN